MIPKYFRTLWSSILMLRAAALLRVLCISDPSVRLAGWAAFLCASLMVGIMDLRSTYAQAASELAARATFEVASVKPSAPQAGSRGQFPRQNGGPGTSDPGRIRYSFMSLKALMIAAFDVKDFQIAGPGWLDTERFDITAKVPRGARKEQVRVMLRNLIIDRFKLAIHRETRDQSVYWLTVANPGPKLKESAPEEIRERTATVEEAGSPPRPEMGPDGFPLLSPTLKNQTGLFAMMMIGRSRAIAHRQTMQELANWLTAQLNRQVADHTGLSGRYDFVLTFAAEPTAVDVNSLGGQTVFALKRRGPATTAPNPDDGSTPSVFTAVQEQLGLRLERKRGSAETIVVDHIERRPTEN